MGDLGLCSHWSIGIHLWGSWGPVMKVLGFIRGGLGFVHTGVLGSIHDGPACCPSMGVLRPSMKFLGSVYGGLELCSWGGILGFVYTGVLGSIHGGLGVLLHGRLEVHPYRDLGFHFGFFLVAQRGFLISVPVCVPAAPTHVTRCHSPHLMPWTLPTRPGPGHLRGGTNRIRLIALWPTGVEGLSILGTGAKVGASRSFFPRGD